MAGKNGGGGKSAPAGVYEAKDSFQGTLDDGSEVFVNKGERVRDGHAIVRKWPTLFQPLTVQYDIEDASAEPGVKRSENPASAGKERTK